MRIGLLSDLHANLPFAEAAVRRARRFGCDRIIHLGDAIDLGPWPSETLDVLVEEGVELIRGDHDEYPVFGMPPSPAALFAEEIRDHMSWTASQLRTDQFALLAALPLKALARIEEWSVRLQHCLLDGNRVSGQFLDEETERLPARFGAREREIVCFGHIHERLWHFAGERGVLNPGATGFAGPEGAWFAILTVREQGVWVEWHPVESRPNAVVTELERRAVPAREASVSCMFAAATA